MSNTRSSRRHYSQIFGMQGSASAPERVRETGDQHGTRSGGAGETRLRCLTAVARRSSLPRRWGCPWCITVRPDRQRAYFKTVCPSPVQTIRSSPRSLPAGNDGRLRLDAAKVGRHDQFQLSPVPTKIRRARLTVNDSTADFFGGHQQRSAIGSQGQLYRDRSRATSCSFLVNRAEADAGARWPSLVLDGGPRPSRRRGRCGPGPGFPSTGGNCMV